MPGGCVRQVKRHGVGPVSPMKKQNPIRITLRDTEQTISFLSNEDTLHRLIAACSAEPTTVAEVLTAADIFEQGLAARVMAELMEFDRTFQSEGLEPIHRAMHEAAQNGRPFEGAFQAVDRLTKQEALRPAHSDIVLIDLIDRQIGLAADLTIETTGEIRLKTKAGVTDRKVTYMLPQSWKIARLELPD